MQVYNIVIQSVTQMFKYINERFLGSPVELWGVTFCVINIGLDSLRHGENECRGQQ